MHTRTAYRTALSVAVLLTALVFTWSAYGTPADGTTGIDNLWVGTAATPPATNATYGAISSAAGGTIITITGNGFVGATNVYFNATYAPGTSPANGDVIGTNVQGWSGGGHGFIAATPAASFQVNSDSIIFARVPPNGHSGPVVVCSPTGCVESLGIGGSSNGVLYGITNGVSDFIPDTGGDQNPPPPTPTTLPTINYYTPGYVKVGQTVAMYGSNFTGATAVKVSGKTAKFHVRSDTSIVFTVPAGVQPGLRHVGVTSPAGQSIAKGVGITIVSS